MPAISSARLFALVYASIFVAELPDKTALAALLLAAEANPAAVFVGAAGAFVVQSAVAVAFGGLLGRLPARPLRAAVGILFLAFAAFLWRGRARDEGASVGASARSFAASCAGAFLAVFAAEWGDMTQLATAALAARWERPVVVFSAATAALWSVTALAVWAGSRLGRRFDPRRLERGAAALFAALGAWFLLAG